jgi:ADP-heptose:LPS heptosyltransferase
MSQALILQLARLGDAIQSLPVITSLHTHFPEQQLDLLCAAPLVPLGQLFPGIHGVYPWEGEKWHSFSAMSNPDGEQQLEAAGRYLTDLAFPDYSLAYNLNNHPRSILASHVLSERVIGAGYQGPLNPSCPPWVGYLQKVARERGNNRIHLADAFCGLSGVKPPVVVPTIQACDSGLPSDLVQIANDSSLVRIGIVLGAGDVDRRVPLATWRRLIEACVHHLPHCLCVLIGGAGEREAALALEDQFSPLYLSRILNCVGRTTLPQLAQVFNRCQWVIGSDTGPLHLGVACGARAIGWYFSRARVHETGPYGVGHYVWQHRSSAIFKNIEVQGLRQKQELPYSWPVMETIQLMLDERVGECSSEWNLWTSHRDEWGVFYTNEGKSDDMVLQRKETWERLSALGSHQDAFLMPREMIAG